MLKKIIFLFFLSMTFQMTALSLVNARDIRVAVLKEATSFSLTIPGRYLISNKESGDSLLSGRHMKTQAVRLSRGKITIDGESFFAKNILIDPVDGGTASVGARVYRGNLLVINNDGKSLTVVNTLDLEQYVRGVLYHEISDKWPIDAMMAQAVATRTYAVYSIQKFSSRDFDVTNDIYSQVYGGKTGERYRTNLAVKRTQGQVLTYKDEIFPTFFHANSGGITEAASELWDIGIEPLKGNIESPFSKESPHYNWKRNFRLKDIQDKLALKGYDVGLIGEIQVVARNKSGRVKQLKLIGRNAQEKIVPGKSFREIVGPNNIRSNKYDIHMKGWYVDFIGNGWGHGVGMCQWGAYNMARERYSYRDILSFYYPSSILSRVQ